MDIIDLDLVDPRVTWETAALLTASLPLGWPDMDSARAEVTESVGPDRISRIVLGEQGSVIGWVAARPEYAGRVWELHPLVVHPAHRRLGVGRALVEDLEAHVRARGGLTLWLGTDDEDGGTTLFGQTLYPHPLDHLRGISNLRDHPYGFYEKLGFVVVGVVPDANGRGKPDILMAKAVYDPGKLLGRR
jgi:aminoglycoside 6'-N-acetyltransferase I